MFRYVIFLVLMLLVSPCQAQDGILPASYKRDGTGSITTPRADETINEHDLNDRVLLDLDLHWMPPRVSFPDYWTSYATQPKVRYTYRYKGFYGLIHKQFTRATMKFYRRALRNTWGQSHLHPADLNRLRQQYALRSSDPQHPWWQREFFFEYLPVEKGGSYVENITVGNDYEIISAGPLALSNSGRVAWSGWRLSVSPDRDLPSRKLRRDLDGTTVEDDSTVRDPQRLSLGISPPSGNLYTGDHWTVSGSVKFGVRVNTLTDNKTSVTGKIEILGYTGINKNRFISIQIKGRARPFIDDYGVEVSFALLTF